MVDRLLLHDLYYTPGLPTAYSGIDRIYKAPRSTNRKVRRQDVEKWLLAQDVYTLHKRAKKRLSAEPRVHVSHMDEQWAMDLCDVKNISRYNNRCNFILTVIDVFSKWADAEPVPTKTAGNTTQALEAILARTNRRPQKIETDHGKEFYNNTFAALCRREGIHHFSTQSSHKASVVERFNRSLKELMYKHFSAENTYRWIDVLGKLIDTYNSRYHRSIGMSPNEVTYQNEDEVYRTLYKKRPISGKKLKQGDLVRISEKRHIFEKGYLPNFTEEVFKVAKVISNHTPHRYELEDLSGERIDGRFAPEEIQETIKGPDNLWKIEKIIRQVKRADGVYYFIKWRGFPDKFNSFVREEDIIHLVE
jgi:transposase InsO family protein